MLDEKNIIEIYQNNNFTIKQIAIQFNSSYEIIRELLKKNHIAWKRKYVSNFTNEQIQNIIMQYQDGNTIKQIAAQYEISAPAISRLLKINNVQVICSMHKYDNLRQMPFTDTQKQFIVGNLLGDGCLYKETEKSNYKISLGQCEEQKKYFDWKVAIMQPFITCFRRSVDKRQNSIMWQAASITHPDFNNFGKAFYDSNKIKTIPPNLDRYFTPLTLAIWIMDDGYLNAGVNMRIATMSFTEAEHYILQDYLYRIFNLKSKVMSFGDKYFQLCLDKDNTQKLSNIIRPYIIPCMSYKIM